MGDFTNGKAVVNSWSQMANPSQPLYDQIMTLYMDRPEQELIYGVALPSYWKLLKITSCLVEGMKDTKNLLEKSPCKLSWTVLYPFQNELYTFSIFFLQIQ